MALVEAFAAAGVPATVVDRSVRVQVPNAEADAAGKVRYSILPVPEFAVGDRVAVRVNERNRTAHVGEVRQVKWHIKDARYNFYLSENGKKISKRYLAEDLERVSS